MTGDIGLNWSGVFQLKGDNEHLVPDAPGVYRIRIVDDRGMSLPILRRGGVWDEDGIMYVGGTTRMGPLRSGFRKQRGAHDDGMRGKIEKNGVEQDLVELWRSVRLVYPNARLTFQFAQLADHAQAVTMRSRLHLEYAMKFGEKPLSGKNSLLHDSQHPWRRYLAEQAGRSLE